MKASKQVPVILLIFLAGCTVTPTPTSTPSPPVIVDTESATPTHTLEIKKSTPTPTPTPLYILPSVTMSPQEVDLALRELLRTNGGCKGKCIAGIYPDEMTIQEMVDQMAHWGNLVQGNNLIGGAYVTIDQFRLADEVNVYLGMHSREATLKSIEQLSLRIDRNIGF